jgi:hypothetical protein
MNAVAERWLNDSSISKAGIMLIAANQGALYFGTHLRPIKLGYKNREILDWYPEMDRCRRVWASRTRIWSGYRASLHRAEFFPGHLGGVSDDG